MQKKSGIYRIVVSRPGDQDRYYIGQAKNMYVRCRQHVSRLRAGRHANPGVQRAYNKYGELSVTFEEILVCDPSALTMYEQIVVDFYLATYEPGLLLNILTTCVSSHLGIKRTAATRAKMSASMLGKKKTPDQIAEMSARLLGRRHNETTRARMSATHKAMPERHPNSLAALAKARKSQSRLDGLRAALAGKPKVHSDETKAKIAASLTGMKQTPELVERRISKIRGRKQSHEEISKRVASRLANARAKAPSKQESPWPSSDLAGGQPSPKHSR